MKKALLIMAVLFSTISMYAQDSTSKKTPEERATMYVKELNKELSLSADQSVKIQGIQLESIKKVEEIRSKDGDKKEIRKQVKSVNDGANEAIKTNLTAEQKPKFDAWLEQKKEKAKNKTNGKATTGY
jgi:Spy/CpxP family protein refolding chaperone